MTVATNCPDDLALFAFATGATRDTRGDAQVAAHIERCERCRSQVERHRALAADVRRATREVGDVSGECLDELALAALAEGIATGDALGAATAHLVTCTSCRSQLAELRAALDDGAIAAELPQGGSTHRRRSSIMGASAAGLAAAAVLAFAIGPKLTHHDMAAPMRDETGTFVVAPVAVAPVDVVSGGLVFRWSSVPGANIYRVRVFDPEGVVVWETQTTDTTVAPASVTTLARGARYLWKVEARTDFDRWVGSALTEFKLSADGVKP